MVKKSDYKFVWIALSPKKKKILRPFSILDGILSSLLMLFIQVFKLNKLIFRKTFKS